MSTLVGWAGGDAFKYQFHVRHHIFLLNLDRTAYFFWQGSPIQFKACAVFQLSIDFGMCSLTRQEKYSSRLEAIVIQRLVYGNAPPPSVLIDDEDLEQALALAEE